MTGFLYIEHMLRRLNIIRNTLLIKKTLKSPPENTQKIYDELLGECKRNYTVVEQKLLSYLFVWLACSKKQFTLAAAQIILDLAPVKLDSRPRLDLEEGVMGRLSK